MRISQLASAAALFIAVAALALPASALAAEPAIGLIREEDGPGSLITFDTSGRIHDVVDIDDAGMGYETQAIALRPSTGVLYLVSTLNTGPGVSDTAGRIYTVDLVTGATTLVGAGDFSAVLADNTGIGISFDPVADVIRFVTTFDTNLRLSPTTGMVVGADAPLAPAGFIASIAYDRAFATPPTASTAYALDWPDDELVRVGGVDGTPSASGGVVTVLGMPLSMTSNATMAFAPSGSAYLLQGEQDTATRTAIFSLDVQAATTTRIGSLRPRIDDVAFLPGSTVSVAPTATAAEGAGFATVPVTRTGNTALATTVTFTTSNGTATAGSDFVATTGTATIPAGATTGQAIVPLIGDGTPELSKTFTVTITDATTSLLGSTVASTVTITDVAPVAPVADTDKPIVLTVPVKLISTKAWTKRGLTIAYSCSEGCTATGKVTAGRATIATTGSSRIAKAGTGKLTLKLTKASAAALALRVSNARTRRVALALPLTFVDAAGNKRAVRLTTVAVA